MKSIWIRILLALAVLAGAAPAQAAPVTYHVTVDTSSLAGQSGYVDFLLLALGGADAVQARISNFTGNYTAGSFATGDVSGSVAAGISIGNGAAWNEYARWASFGGVFSFNVSFISGAGTGAGTNLGIALLDADFNYLGTAADVVTFALQSGVPAVVTTQVGVATVSTVPEPSAMLQLVAGLMLVAGAARARQRR